MTEMIGYVASEQWEKLTVLLLGAVEQLAAAGADFAAVASNTPHIVFDKLNKRSKLPLLSIVGRQMRYASVAASKKLLSWGRSSQCGAGSMPRRLEKYGIEAVLRTMRRKNEVYGLIYPNLENGLVHP